MLRGGLRGLAAVAGYLAAAVALEASGVHPALAPLLAGLGVALLGGAPAGRAPAWERQAGPSLLERLSRELAEAQNELDLASRVAAACRALAPTGAMYLWLPRAPEGDFDLSAGYGPEPEVESLSAATVREFMEGTPHGDLARWLEDESLSVFLPLVTQKRLLGFITLRPGKNGLGEPELWTLRQIAAQASLALASFRAHREERLGRSKVEGLHHQLRDAQRRAVTDGLTGIATRVFFQEELAKRFRESGRFSSPLSLLLIDVDHFKRFNDSFGHLTGDRVLKVVSRTLLEASRGCDTVARYGGEEFAMILPQTDMKGAQILAERIRQEIARLETTDQHGKRLPAITVSVGVAQRLSTDGKVDDLLDRSDRALYDAKRAGRNQVKLGIA